MVQGRDNPNKPPSITEDELNQPSIGAPSGGGMKLGGKVGGNFLQTVIISLVVAIVVFVGMGMLGYGNFVTKSDFTKNVGSVANDLGTLKTDVASNQTSMQSSINAIPNTVSQAVTNALKDINTQLANATKTANDAKTEADGLTAKINDVNAAGSAASTSVTQSATNLANYQTSNDAAVKVLQTQVTNLQNQVAALQSMPTPTATSITTPTPTSTTTTVANLPSSLIINPTIKVVSPTTGITASIIGNPFNNATYMTIQVVSGTNSGAFNIQLQNTTNADISGIQLAVGLAVYDNSNSNVPVQYAGLPKNRTLVSSGGLSSTLWTEQSTGVPYIIGFVNQSNTGVFSNLGNLSVSANTTATYNQVFSFTN